MEVTKYKIIAKISTAKDNVALILILFKKRNLVVFLVCIFNKRSKLGNLIFQRPSKKQAFRRKLLVVLPQLNDLQIY